MVITAVSETVHTMENPVLTAAYEAHQPPVPPPPRPPRPVKMPGHLVTADSTAEAAQCLAQQVFYVKDKNLMQSIRQRHPMFLLDAQAQQLHGVFQRTLDAQQLLQDLTQAPGQRGYQVHVVPLYAFPVAVDLEAVEDLLVPQHHQQQQQQQQQATPGNSSGAVSYEPILGSFQHGALWEAFMKTAKKQHKAMESIDEEQQQLEGVPPPPPPPPPPRPAAAAAAGANGHS